MNKSLIYKYRLLIILVGLIVLLSILSPRFLTITNLSNVFWAVAVIGIMASGSIYTIITGGIDLSVGSVAALSTIMFAYCFVLKGFGFIESIVITLFAGTLVGFINGYVITRFKVPPFIATMASLNYVFGAAMLISGGETIGILEPRAFLYIGLGKLFGIPFPVYIMLFCLGISYWLLNYSVYGRKIIAVGGNRDAARLSGINDKKIILYGYIISGFTAAISGIVLASMTQQAKATMAQGYEMDVITAIVLGGTSLAGGHGSVTGALFGTLLVGFISNGLNLMNVASPYHSIVKGFVIVIAIIFDIRVKSGYKGSLKNMIKKVTVSS